MNITKQQWTIIGVVVAIIAVWYFFLRKKKTESGYAVPTTDQMKAWRRGTTFLPESGYTSGCSNGTYICGVIGSGANARVKCCREIEAGGNREISSGVNI